jgi:hypothetical protein
MQVRQIMVYVLNAICNAAKLLSSLDWFGAWVLK